MEPTPPSALRLVLATRNPGKTAELRSLLAGLGVEIESLADFPAVPELEEKGHTYVENAEAKAAAAVRACGVAVLADDSGLEVDALDGAPGVRSARFSGGGAAGNIDKLLQALRSVPQHARTARFRCVIVVMRPDGHKLTVEGTCEGIIATAPRGERGFGYDPVFIDPASGRALAELPEAQKNRISHRGRACAALRPKLADFLRAPSTIPT